VALRTATHPFNYVKRKDSPYAKYSFNSREYKGGYGRQVLGETWISHYGEHQRESTRGLVAKAMEDSPLVRAAKTSGAFGRLRTDDARRRLQAVILARSQRHETQRSAQSQQEARAVAWIKTLRAARARPPASSRRRWATRATCRARASALLVNACFWALGMEDKIPERAKSISWQVRPTPSVSADTRRASGRPITSSSGRCRWHVVGGTVPEVPVEREGRADKRSAVPQETGRACNRMQSHPPGIMVIGPRGNR